MTPSRRPSVLSAPAMVVLAAASLAGCPKPAPAPPPATTSGPAEQAPQPAASSTPGEQVDKSGGAICRSLLAGSSTPSTSQVAYVDVFSGSSAGSKVGAVYVRYDATTGCDEYWAVKGKASAGGGTLSGWKAYEFKARSAVPESVTSETSFISYVKGASQLGAAITAWSHKVTVYTVDACSAAGVDPSACPLDAPPAYPATACPTTPPPDPGKEFDVGTTQASFQDAAGVNVRQAYIWTKPEAGGGRTERAMILNAADLEVGPVCFTHTTSTAGTEAMFLNCTCKWMGGGTGMTFVKTTVQAPTEP